MTETLGADLLAVVARFNRLATQRARMPLGFAQARLLSTVEDQGAARISDLAALDARAVLIRITDKGVETLRQVRMDRGAAIAPYLERLDDADRQTLGEAVRVLRRLLTDASAPAAIPN
jgi:hypothetical protein